MLIDVDIKKANCLRTCTKGDIEIKEVPLLITFQHLLKDFASGIRKHLYILYMNAEVKKIFTPGPMVSFQETRKLERYIVKDNCTP